MTKKKRKKPKKKDAEFIMRTTKEGMASIDVDEFMDGLEASGYNQACDDWEKYSIEEYKRGYQQGWGDRDRALPSEDEISQLIRDTRVREGYLARDVCDVLAKAIHKRINGK